jgi:acyl-CoA synthetase (AMP-forming)/AMP-acid ligase II
VAGPAPPSTGEVTSLGQLLEGRAHEGTALVEGDLRLSFDDVRTQVAAVAQALRVRGVGRGDVVAWQLPNWHETVVLYRACWSIGAVAAALHHRNGVQELTGQLELLAPALVLGAPGLPIAQVTTMVEIRGDGGYEAMLETPAAGADLAAATAEDRALVMFTSGSSDGPKGVIHTHRSLAHKATAMPRVHGLGRDDVVLMPAPMAHVSGLLNAVLLPGAAGMTAVLMDHWDPAAALDLIEAEAVSYMVGPPTFFLELMQAPTFSPERVASLRVISCGGTGVTPAFVEQASELLGARVKRSYGSTEAPTVATWHEGDPPERAATTDGRAVGDVELRIATPGAEDPLPTGDPGELLVRGMEVFAGYLGVDPSQTFTPGGWFATGDLATIDADGWLTVVGRCKDVIIRGGENISPAEVESALEAHPAVRQAVAVGVPDERLGEVVAAAVVADDALDTDPAAWRAWFEERGVARFKAPALVVRLPELPRLGSGKPDRRAIRDLLIEGAER